MDEFTQVVGCHRKAAIRLLHRVDSLQRGKRRGCRRRYGREVVDALRKVWEASDRLCSKHLRPFLAELVKVMRQHGELAVNAGVEAELCQMSASTIDRMLRPYRRLGVRQRLPFPLLGLDSGILTEAKQWELAATYHGLNPVLLLKQINENLECLWKLAERPASQQKKVIPRPKDYEKFRAPIARILKQVGLLEPIIVRPRDDQYEVVVGERRYRAAQQAGLDTVTVIIRDYTDDEVEVSYRSEVTIVGRLATFGDRVMRAKAKEVEEEFTQALNKRLSGENMTASKLKVSTGEIVTASIASLRGKVAKT